jgi:CRP-like cAMP-binding protein
MSVHWLSQSVLFKDFTPTGLAIIAGIAKTRVVLAGKVLFSEGAESAALSLIVAGRVRILIKGSDGKDVPIASLGPGEHLGELSLLSRDRRPLHLCTAIAEVDSRVLEIHDADFSRTMEEKPKACLKLLMAIAVEFGRKVADSGDAIKQLVVRAGGR